MIDNLPVGWLAPLAILVAALLPRIFGCSLRPKNATSRSQARPADRSSGHIAEEAARIVSSSLDTDLDLISSADDPRTAAIEARRRRENGTD